MIVLNSKRLQSLLDALPRAVAVADIGSDHGFLAVEAVRQRNCSVVASDIVAGPLSQTRAWAARRGVKIDLRQGDGLAVLRPGEVHTVVMAGMGGDTMAQILNRSGAALTTFPHWIFQPMTRPETLRECLCQRGLRVSREWVVEEEERFYVFLTAHWGSSIPDPRLRYHYPGLSYEQALRLGPKLLLNPALVVQRYFAQRLRRLETFAASLPQNLWRQNHQLQNDIRIWKQVMLCHSQFNE